MYHFSHSNDFFLGTPRFLVSMSLLISIAIPAHASSDASSAPVAKRICTVVPPATGADVQDGYAWKPLVVGGGGFIMSLDVSADGAERIARNDTYGAHRWEGNRWKQLVTAQSMPADDVVPGDSGEGVTELVFAPSDSRRLYMQFKGFVYRSDNRGDTWQRTAFARVAMGPNDEYRQQGPRLAVDPANADVVYAGTQMDGLFVSVNGGALWNKVNAIPRGMDEPLPDPNQQDNRATKGPGIKVWYDPSSPVVAGRKQGIVVNSNANGFWRSSNGGATWQQISSPGNGPTKVDHGVVAANGTLYMAAYKDNKLWRYRNNAWVDISVPGGCCYPTIAADPFNPNSIWAFDGGRKVWRSTDGGANWTEIARSFSSAGDVPWLSRPGATDYFTTSQVRFDTQQRGRLWISMGTGIWKADVSDTVTTIAWQAETRGIEQLVGNDVIAPPGQKPVVGGWDFGARVKDDLDAFTTTWGPNERFHSSWQLDWSPSNPAFIVTNFSDHRFCCSEDGQAVAGSWSSDGGRTWTRFEKTPFPPGGNPNNPWAFGFGNIVVAANDVNNIVWLPTFNLAPQYTRDRGKTWNLITLPEQDAAEPGSHTTFSRGRKVIAADRVLPNTFYYAHSGQGFLGGGLGKGLWRSTDGGANWTRMFADQLAPFSTFGATLKAVPSKAGHLFYTAGPLDGVDSPFRRSTDGGATWNDVAGLTRVYAFGFGKAAAGSSYPTIFVAGKLQGAYGIYRSTDNAATWQRIAQYPTQSLDVVKAIDGDKDVFGRVYIALGGSGWVYGTPQ
jgi:photosystem II stability/assembly factor-like uncharacterized protein